MLVIVENQRKKTDEDKFSYEKMVEMNKVLISAYETSTFYKCYDYNSVHPPPLTRVRGEGG